MNKTKKAQAAYIVTNELSHLPTIAMPPTILTQPAQRNTMELKESDFIKRIKKTKSFIIANQNRKQKNVLNLYISKPHRKSKYFIPITQSNNSLTKSSHNKTRDTTIMELEKLLFPPVHSSVQVGFRSNRKHKTKCQSFNINTNDIESEREYNRNKNRLLLAIKQRDQYQQSKKTPKSITKEQIQREKINQTQQKQKPSTIKAEILYSYSPRTHFPNPYKNKNKMYKIFKSLTEEPEKLLNESDDIGRWQFRKAEDQHQLAKDNF